MNGPYHDKRADFFRRYYEQAASYDEYLQTGTEGQQKRWADFAANLKPDEQLQQRVRDFRRKMPALVLSGIWCGDCARQGPMLRLLEKLNPIFSFRFIDNRANPELQEELRINGAEKVPVVVTFSEDFYEVGRFGDRHLSVYRQKAAKELGAACDPGFGTPREELMAELHEWVDYYERLDLLLRLSPALRKRYGD